jgi:hypothetical protein
MNLNCVSRPLICLASEIGATELAIFSVQRHHRLGRSLKLYLHVRPGVCDDPTRQAAIDAFRDLIGPCIDQERDGVICLADSPHGGCQYCVIGLLHRSGDLVGVAAFIVRRDNIENAKSALDRVRRDVQKLGL